MSFGTVKPGRAASPKARRQAALLRRMTMSDSPRIYRSDRRDNAWTAILPDVSGNAAVRLQYFDTKGFSGHSVYRHWNDACREALAEGYWIPDDTALDRIQDTPDFRRGLFQAELIRLHNEGAITLREVHERFQRFEP